jgi:hypothetical protein
VWAYHDRGAMDTHVETVARNIPEGKSCGACPYHNGKWCSLFNEPYTGTKNLYCFRNRHIATVHRAWDSEGE